MFSPEQSEFDRAADIFGVDCVDEIIDLEAKCVLYLIEQGSVEDGPLVQQFDEKSTGVVLRSLSVMAS